MPVAVHNPTTVESLATMSGPLPSRLISELLDGNHDAWRVCRQGRSWTFYREIGHGHPRLPFGAIVLKTEPGKPQTFDFYTSRGKRSLLPTYGEEVCRAAQALMDREYVIGLFTKCAVDLSSKNWDHQLSFCGDQLKERSARLRYGTDLYDRIVGTPLGRFSKHPTGGDEAAHPRKAPGLVVFQRENDVPWVQCLISYPRRIENSFYSSRLTEGLEAVTGEMVSVITELNRSVDNGRYFDGGEV